MRRYYLIGLALAVLVAGAVLGVTHAPSPARAATSHRAVAYVPATTKQNTRPDASLVVARQFAAVARAAHVAHIRHEAHIAHLHVLHLRQLAIWAARAQAHAAAAQLAATHVAPAAPSSNETAASVAPAHASGTYTGSGSMQQCIIRAESGGNSQVMNSTSHYGLYQFSASTWAASGGNPADFGNASVSEQNQVFANAVAARGYSDWTPYDGC